MWICPKCKREFKRQNQGHYCGNAPQNVDEYIKAQEEAHQKHLSELTALIHSLVPNITEEIKWSMPSFRRNAISIQFAACKKYISLYIGADVISVFQEKLVALTSKKDVLYIPYDAPIPKELVTEIIRWKFSEEQASI